MNDALDLPPCAPEAVLRPGGADRGAARVSELAEAGDAAAQTELGERYEEGGGGVVRDYEAAVALYRRAAEQGDARGQGKRGAMYSNGWGVPQDQSGAW